LLFAHLSECITAKIRDLTDNREGPVPPLVTGRTATLLLTNAPVRTVYWAPVSARFLEEQGEKQSRLLRARLALVRASDCFEIPNHHSRRHYGHLLGFFAILMENNWAHETKRESGYRNKIGEGIKFLWGERPRLREAV